MTPTIPASAIVSVNPGVVSSGGNPLSVNGMVLTQNALVPTGSVQSFVGTPSVSAFFGPASAELVAAEVYFSGNDNSSIKPGTLYFAPFIPTGGVAAWLQSGNLSALTLTQLQALSGTLILTVNGTSETTASINLSAATSFSNAASIIQTAFSTLTVHVTCSWNSINSMFLLSSPTLGAASTITYATGTLSTGLLFTQATGAIISQGAIADTEATAMANAIANTTNWVLFTTMWEPTLTSKEAFAVWTNGQNQRFGYVAWDSDSSPTTSASATGSFGYIVDQLEYNTVCPVWNTLALAMLFLGTAACINFNATNGRITFSFKTQSGFVPTVTNAQVAANLIANGYSFYGSYATADEVFNWIYNGQVSGLWSWLDTFVNQVYLNSQFQLALMELLENVNSIPYNNSGYALIRAAMQDPINQFLNFGGIQKGVTLSSAQAAEVNQAAGIPISSIIEQNGYYLQILDPGSQVRGNRGTPVINFWYTDGGAVQQITLASIDIQ